MKTLLIYRDDGPLAKLLGRANPVAPSLLLLLAVLPLGVVICLGERGDAVVAAVLAWLVLLGGLSRGGNTEADRFAWAIPSLLRAGEYAALIWLAPAATLAVLTPLALRHYDLVYALRYRGGPPTSPTGGWDGRLVIAFVLYVLDALPGGFYVLGGILGALFLADTVASWTRNDDTQGDAA
ncbi:MAG: DUF5941 domain-containing protein [Solirubrobacteraceae bacterium]